jgi:sugar O-acyltransferase (sialic acid O-acetyltransferase NeuD family)
MTSRKVVIIGAGGFGRELLDVFDACNQDKNQYDVLGFIVQKEYAQPGSIVNDRPILGDFDWLEKHSRNVYAICGVGDPHHKRRLTKIAADLSVRFCPSVIHPLACKSRWVELGDGSVITAGCILTTQIKIGEHVHVNLDCTIGHDTTICDYATVAPGVHVSGKVLLGEGCYIGTGANIIEKLNIGEWSVVGAGSAIVKDVPANTTVVGVPGKIIKEREVGWHLK